MKKNNTGFWETLKREILKTTLIGKKMFSATKETTILKDLHEVLGYTLVNKIREKKIVLDDPEINEIINKIDTHEESLDALEQDVNQIKAS
jgi:hypothetical protein